jgi:alpha-tubulin suppressor-like RCC1 family protein
MPYQPTTNFKDSDGVDLGKKLIPKNYVLEVYGSLLDSLVPGLTPTPALWSWGRNDSGQLGTNDLISRSTPVTTFLGGNNWKSVATGFSHTAAIKTDGTLWTWGSNGNGQLGDNTSTTRSTPVTTFLGGNNWKQVVCFGSSFGVHNTAAIKTDGTLWTWGTGNFGQLGINLPGPSGFVMTPVTTFAGGTNWKSVTCGDSFMTAIKTDGTLWTWGINSSGKLGINSSGFTSIMTPVTTFAGGNNWKSVASGDNNTLAIKTDGTLWSWGSNVSGQLGDNTTTNRITPVTTFAGGNNWKSVASGYRYTAAVKTDGTLWSWGSNVSGKLGIDPNELNATKITPVTTFAGGNNWKQVAISYNHTAAIKTDGTLWTWGINSSGQLGINNIGVMDIGSMTPVTTFLGGNNWKSVASGGNHTIAIQSIDYI